MDMLFLLSVFLIARVDYCTSLWISLTVSPFTTTNPPRPLLISWGDAIAETGDWVGLLNDSQVLTTPLASAAVHETSGLFNTTYAAPVLTSSHLRFTPECLDYWAVYVGANGTVLASTCLKTEPTWMEEMKQDLSKMKFSQVFLPGTHDSGSYKEYRSGDVETIVTKYSITQEDDVLVQLMLGVRYIDLRVGHYPSTAELWWVNHGVVRIRPLSDLLKSVKTFINNTNELVILDVQEFPTGFDSSTVHWNLVEYLLAELGQFLASPTLGWSATLGDIWKSGNRLILSYDEDSIQSNSAILWQSVRQLWGDKRTVQGLYEYLLQNAINPPAVRPTAAMAELTPNAWSVITDEFGGLRPMAAMVSHNVTEWYRRDSWGRYANIVAVDFLKSTDIVQVALSWNRRRARNLTSL